MHVWRFVFLCPRNKSILPYVNRKTKYGLHDNVSRLASLGYLIIANTRLSCRPFIFFSLSTAFKLYKTVDKSWVKNPCNSKSHKTILHLNLRVNLSMGGVFSVSRRHKIIIKRYRLSVRCCLKLPLILFQLEYV